MIWSCRNLGARGLIARTRPSRTGSSLIQLSTTTCLLRPGAGILTTALNWPEFPPLDRSEGKKYILQNIAAATEDGRTKWQNTLSFFLIYHDLGVVPTRREDDKNEFSRAVR